MARIGEIAQQIAHDYEGKEPHLICVLNGAFMFHADLVRAIRMPLTVDFFRPAVTATPNSRAARSSWSRI